MVVRALFTAHVGQFEQIHENELFLDNHPLVKQHPEWFSADLEPIARGYTGPVSIMEEATAEPGTRRATRPKTATQ